MGEHVTQRQPLQPARIGGQGGKPGRVQAEPVHAGIDMQQRGQTTADAAGERGPAVDVAERAEHRQDVVFEVLAFAAGRRTVQGREHGPGQQRAEGYGLGQMGGEEVAASGRVQIRGDPGGAQAIGVGLDYRGNRAGRRTAAQQLPVGGDCGEVDVQDGGGVRPLDKRRGEGGFSRHRGEDQGRQNG